MLKRKFINENNQLKHIIVSESIDSRDEIILEKNSFALAERSWFGETFLYTIYDQFDDPVKRIKSEVDLLNMTTSEIRSTNIYKEFLDIAENNYKEPTSTAKKVSSGNYGNGYSYGYGSGNWGRSNYSGWEPKRYPEEEINAIVDKYTKSKTLAIHKTDPTTTMLAPIYAGKGWDVINDTYSVPKQALYKILEKHDRIVALGHGYSGGLIGSIDNSCAPYMRGKKLFFLWCNADDYARNHPELGTGYFCCGNMPSDAGEARCVGYNVSRKYMDDNITDWCQYCADEVENCLEGDANAACKRIRDRYWAKYGHSANPNEVGITCYNYRRTKVAGQDLIPEPADYTYEVDVQDRLESPYYTKTSKNNLENKDIEYSKENIFDYPDDDLDTIEPTMTPQIFKNK